ncbi:hypothetical protein Tco_1392595 [Tanacetum coccineum]
MAPKRTTISTPATTTTPTTYVTDKELKRLIDQGVADALSTTECHQSGNGEDSHMIQEWLMFPEESKKIEKYVGGLPDMILQEDVEFASKA